MLERNWGGKPNPGEAGMLEIPQELHSHEYSSPRMLRVLAKEGKAVAVREAREWVSRSLDRALLLSPSLCAGYTVCLAIENSIIIHYWSSPNNFMYTVDSGHLCDLERSSKHFHPSPLPPSSSSSLGACREPGSKESAVSKEAWAIYRVLCLPYCFLM